MPVNKDAKDGAPKSIIIPSNRFMRPNRSKTPVKESLNVQRVRPLGIKAKTLYAVPPTPRESLLV